MVGVGYELQASTKAGSTSHTAHWLDDQSQHFEVKIKDRFVDETLKWSTNFPSSQRITPLRVSHTGTIAVTGPQRHAHLMVITQPGRNEFRRSKLNK